MESINGTSGACNGLIKRHIFQLMLGINTVTALSLCYNLIIIKFIKVILFFCQGEAGPMAPKGKWKNATKPIIIIVIFLMIM